VRAISSVHDLKAQNEQLVARLDAMLDLEGSELILEGRRTGLVPTVDEEGVLPRRRGEEPFQPF